MVYFLNLFHSSRRARLTSHTLIVKHSLLLLVIALCVLNLESVNALDCDSATKITTTSLLTFVYSRTNA